MGEGGREEVTRYEQTPTCTITLPGRTSSTSKHSTGRPEAKERSWRRTISNPARSIDSNSPATYRGRKKILRSNQEHAHKSCKMLLRLCRCYGFSTARSRSDDTQVSRCHECRMPNSVSRLRVGYFHPEKPARSSVNKILHSVFEKREFDLFGSEL